jgi:predicted  nucleic acid-binding Zn-ribbon protein
MEINTGQSLVETKEYFELLRFKENIEKNALVIKNHGNKYNHYIDKYITYFTTDESINFLTEELNTKNEEINKLKEEILLLEHQVKSLTVENKNLNEQLLKNATDMLITKTKSVSFFEKLFKF